MSLAGAQFFVHNFRKSSGAPYAGVRVFHYAAGTLNAQDVWTDEAKVTPAAQPVVGDANGWVSFYADGSYRFQVKSSVADGDLLLFDWDNLRLIAKAATLRAESQGLSLPSAVAATRGHLFATIDANGDVQTFSIQKTASVWQNILFGNTSPGETIVFSKGADVASAATLNLGSDGNYSDVTGTVTVTGISTKPAGTLIALQFDAALILTHNAVSLILPGRTNITTVAGDVLIAISEGAGNWRIVHYMRTTGESVRTVRGADLASAATVDLATSTGNYVHITGTTTITALGTVNAGVQVECVFDGSLTLAHNATSLILKDGVNLITVAGDVLRFRSEGSGNWREVSRRLTRGHGFQGVSEVFTASGTFTVPVGVDRIYVEVYGAGGGGGGGGGSTACLGNAGGGWAGASGGYGADILAVTPGAGHTVTVGAAGTGGTTPGGTDTDGGTGGTGGTSSLGALISATGGGGGHGGAKASVSTGTVERAGSVRSAVLASPGTSGATINVTGGGRGPGTGGTGAAAGGGSNTVGTAGQAGLVIVWY